MASYENGNGRNRKPCIYKITPYKAELFLFIHIDRPVILPGLETLQFGRYLFGSKTNKGNIIKNT